jgi:hypothetical protein
LPRGNSTSLRSPPNEAAPPGPRRLDVEPHLLFERLQVELHEIGETALQHEIRHAAGELRGLVRVTTELIVISPARLLTVTRSSGVGEHISELIAEPPVADSEIIREAERPRPDRRIAQRYTQEVTENFR